MARVLRGSSAFPANGEILAALVVRNEGLFPARFGLNLRFCTPRFSRAWLEIKRVGGFAGFLSVLRGLLLLLMVVLFCDS